MDKQLNRVRAEVKAIRRGVLDEIAERLDEATVMQSSGGSSAWLCVDVRRILCEMRGR